MRRIERVAVEIFDLFVDDAPFAVAIAAWLLVAGCILPRLALAPTAKGPILFAGLAAMLLGSVIRRSRR